MIDLKLGNCLEVLKTIEDNSVDSIVTDPPYGIDFMGKKWDYDVPSTEIWEQCLRVLKPGGYLLAFAGTRTQHRMAVRIEDAGFEIRDMIAWVYGSGFPKSHNISKAIDATILTGGSNSKKIKEVNKIRPGESRKTSTLPNNGIASDNRYGGTTNDNIATEEAKQWDGWGTALKPALEPITVARKPLEEKTVAANVLKYGTGGINIDESRVKFQSDVDKESAKPQGKATYASGRLAGKTQNSFKIVNDESLYWSNIDGWVDKDSATTFNDTNINMPIGYTRMEYIETDRKESQVEQSQLGRFPANLIHNGSDEVTELFPKDRDGSAARFFYCAKASKKDRNDGLEKFEAKATPASEFRPSYTEKAAKGEDGNAYGRWTPTKNNHPTVKPTDLMRYLVNMVTPKGGVTLDPFMGSGSTGRGAVLGNFDFIGIELDPDYYEIAKARIKAVEDSVGVSLEDFFV